MLIPDVHLLQEAFSSRHGPTGKDSDDTRPMRPAIRTGFAASPSKGIASSNVGKRSRDQIIQNSGYSSLLASKLRGVTSFDCEEQLSSVHFSHKTQA